MIALANRALGAHAFAQLGRRRNALAYRREMLELDHVFGMVAEPEEAVARLNADGWVLDAGTTHPRQGTRNRRLLWRGMFFELVWVINGDEASRNALRLDRRAAFATSGASPFGVAFRGLLGPEIVDQYWLYDSLGPRIWIHHDNESAPERPMIFVLETDRHELEQRRRLLGADETTVQPAGNLREIRLHGPSAPTLPQFAGPAISHTAGQHSLELVVRGDGSLLQVGPRLTIRR